MQGFCILCNICYDTTNAQPIPLLKFKSYVINRDSWFFGCGNYWP